MATGRITPSIGSRIIAENIQDGFIGCPFQTRCVQSGKMVGRQFGRVMAFSTVQVFLPHMFFMLARVIAIVLAGSAHVTTVAIGGHIEAPRQPVRGRLTAVAADTGAASARRIIRKNIRLGIIVDQPGNTGRRIRVEMTIGVGTRTVVTGNAYARNLWQAVMHAVGAFTVWPRVAGWCSTVRRIVVTGSAVCENQGGTGRMAIVAGPSDAAFIRSK